MKDIWHETSAEPYKPWLVLVLFMVVEIDHELSPFFLRDSGASETRARVKITFSLSPPRLAFLAWGDIHALEFRSLYYP